MNNNGNILKVLIAGTQGFLGRNLTEYFNNKDGYIPYSWEASFQREFDFLSRDSRHNLLLKSKPDIVIHSIWNTKVGYKESSKNWSFAEATLDFYLQCEESGVKKFITFGTGLETFSREELVSTKQGLYSEYLKSKIVTRNSLFESIKRNSPQVVWIQIFQLYGRGQSQDKFLPWANEKMIHDLSIKIGYPNSKNDWVLVDDVCDLVFNQLRQNQNSILQAGTGKSISNLEIIEELRKVNKSRSSIILEDNFNANFDYKAKTPHLTSVTELQIGLKKSFGEP